MEKKKQILYSLPFTPLEYDTPDKLNRFYSETFQKMMDLASEGVINILDQSDLPNIHYTQNKAYLVAQENTQKAKRGGLRHQLRMIKFTAYKADDCNGNVVNLPDFSFFIGHRRKIPNFYVRVVCMRTRKFHINDNMIYLVHAYELSNSSQQINQIEQSSSTIIPQPERFEEIDDESIENQSQQIQKQQQQQQQMQIKQQEHDQDVEEEEYKNDIVLQISSPTQQLLQQLEGQQNNNFDEYNNDYIHISSNSELDQILPQINLNIKIKEEHIQQQFQQPINIKLEQPTQSVCPTYPFIIEQQTQIDQFNTEVNKKIQTEQPQIISNPLINSIFNMQNNSNSNNKINDKTNDKTNNTFNEQNQIHHSESYYIQKIQQLEQQLQNKKNEQSQQNIIHQLEIKLLKQKVDFYQQQEQFYEQMNQSYQQQILLLQQQQQQLLQQQNQMSSTHDNSNSSIFI